MNITQRNYFTVHDDLEVLSPGKTPVKLDIPYLINSKGEQTEIANRATEKMYFDYPVSFPPHSIIRKTVEQIVNYGGNYHAESSAKPVRYRL